jgi:hypothetical protein
MSTKMVAARDLAIKFLATSPVFVLVDPPDREFEGSASGGGWCVRVLPDATPPTNPVGYGSSLDSALDDLIVQLTRRLGSGKHAWEPGDVGEVCSECHRPRRRTSARMALKEVPLYCWRQYPGASSPPAAYAEDCAEAARKLRFTV